MRSMIAELQWHPGPARGGEGTAGAKDGVSQWFDGDLLLIIVETNGGREFAVVRIDCDEHYFSVYDASSGDDHAAWGPESWEWYAKLDESNLPSQPAPSPK